MMPDPPASPLLFELFEGLPRLGPGTTACTRRALEAIRHLLPPEPRVLDAGCGTGASTRVLADALDGEITAVDIHQPYLDRLEADLGGRAHRARVTTLRADMAGMPLAPGSFDLVWSEGAIFLLGFRRGLEIFGGLLKPGGLVAVSELTWLVESPAVEVARYWQNAYPPMTTRAGNRAELESASFERIADFVLPREAWEAYYTPLKARLPGFLARHEGEPEAESLVRSVRTEIEAFDASRGACSYVFYLARLARGRDRIQASAPAAPPRR